jgi:hypothetical protein
MMQIADNLRGLAEQTFHTLRPFTVWVEDSAMIPILGAGFMLHGGVELRVRTGALAERIAQREDRLAGADEPAPPDWLVPVEPRDNVFPPVALLARLVDIQRACEPAQAGTGPRVQGAPCGCEHRRFDFACPECLRTFIKARATMLGIEVPR